MLLNQDLHTAIDLLHLLVINTISIISDLSTAADL
jgi:hypothetical protein